MNPSQVKFSKNYIKQEFAKAGLPTDNANLVIVEYPAGYQIIFRETITWVNHKYRVAEVINYFLQQEEKGK